MGYGQQRQHVRQADGNFFYVAGIWKPSMADCWLSYRVVMLPTNLDVAPFQDRSGAIIFRRQFMQWLDATQSNEELLAPPPEGTFVVERAELAF
ncbi:putative SOS response-associated peptidase YedK [Sphingobium sp. JAI105]|uniref:SOS response-associated peptidase family protein n=1 Tax=Sphingobium sp. JAI105 TaxID=2787715 RepID=UPI001A23949E|nr:SOS response-associated peptidase family protein [Sphingobium sp. JAI105]MBG6118472.1 putative SOS response-associated peptidase YedK [Sphingobium sp. JAI105]